MKIFRIIIQIFIVFLMINCKGRSDENAILLADREAPMGWISLKIYNDNTFEFISSGLFSDDVYPGTVRISNDTLYFKYSEKIPKSGKTAVINKRYVTYIDGKYTEMIEIKRNKIRN
ncbi:MAG: hypothetical protein ABI426_09175 [Flavobacterium sp.]